MKVIGMHIQTFVAPGGTFNSHAKIVGGVAKTHLPLSPIII